MYSRRKEHLLSRGLKRLAIKKEFITRICGLITQTEPKVLRSIRNNRKYWRREVPSEVITSNDWKRNTNWTPRHPLESVLWRWIQQRYYIMGNPRISKWICGIRSWIYFRQKIGRLEYLVKRKGSGDYENSWLPESYLKISQNFWIVTSRNSRIEAILFCRGVLFYSKSSTSSVTWYLTGLTALHEFLASYVDSAHQYRHNQGF